MFALPLADWISEHLTEIHGIGFNPDNITWVPFVGMAILFATFLYIGLSRRFALLATGVLGSIILLVDMSHHVPHDETILNFLGFSWHVFYLWFAAALLISIVMTAAKDDGEVPGRLRLIVEFFLE